MKAVASPLQVTKISPAARVHVGRVHARRIANDTLKFIDRWMKRIQSRTRIFAPFVSCEHVVAHNNSAIQTQEGENTLTETLGCNTHPVRFSAIARSIGLRFELGPPVQALAMLREVISHPC